MLFAKGPTRAELDDAAAVLERARVEAVRRAVFLREGCECRVCRELYHRHRPAQSMHEIQFRSLGGSISLENSIAVCGSGTSGCHGRLQRRRILVETLTPAGAEGPLLFRERIRISRS